MDSALARGEELYARPDKSQPPLTDTEATAVATYIDCLGPSAFCLAGTDTPYQSKNLHLGVKKDRAQQFLRALSELRDSTDGIDTNTAAEHFHLQTQDEAFQFVKSDARIERHLQQSRA